MLVTLSGMVTEVRLVQPENAPPPILTVPSLNLQLVMPLLVAWYATLLIYIMLPDW